MSTDIEIKQELSKISDLAPTADRLALGGPPECPVRPFCLPGLRQMVPRGPPHPCSAFVLDAA